MLFSSFSWHPIKNLSKIYFGLGRAGYIGIFAPALNFFEIIFGIIFSNIYLH